MTAAADTATPSSGLVAKLLESAETSEAIEAPAEPSVAFRSLSEGLPSSGHWRGNSLFADLDGDGHLDLFTALRRWDRSTPGEGLHVWRGDGAGKWTPAIDGLPREAIEELVEVARRKSRRGGRRLRQA